MVWEIGRSFDSNNNKFVPSRLYDSFMRMETTYLAINDWEIVYSDATIQVVDWSKHGSSNSFGSRVLFRVQVQRLVKPILARVVVWVFLLGIVSFFCFAIDPTDVGDRLSYTTTMLLAIVAFQFVIQSIIPSVPYLTLIDRYNLLVLIFMLLIALESVIVGWHGAYTEDNDDDDAYDDIKNADFIAMIVLLILFGLINVIFIYLAIKASRFEAQKIGKSREEIDEIHKQAGYDQTDGEIQIRNYTRQMYEDDTKKNQASRD